MTTINKTHPFPHKAKITKGRLISNTISSVKNPMHQKSWELFQIGEVRRGYATGRIMPMRHCLTPPVIPTPDIIDVEHPCC